VSVSISTPLLLERLGVVLTPLDRDPHYVFATGHLFGACPRCDRWPAIFVDRDGSWRAACTCWGRPWRKHDTLDLFVAVRESLS
jgi:hypothetical protein